MKGLFATDNAETYKVLRSDVIDPVSAVKELFDGIDGVGWYQYTGFPDFLATTVYFEFCGPIRNQYDKVGVDGLFGQYSPCGADATHFYPWNGIIHHLLAYAGHELYPSKCQKEPII